MEYNSPYTIRYLLGCSLFDHLLELPSIKRDDVLVADLLSKNEFLTIEGKTVVCIFDAYYVVDYD